MKQTVTLTVTQDRTDGSHSTVSETITESVGDNQRFEKMEAERLIAVAAEIVLDKVQGVRSSAEL